MNKLQVFVGDLTFTALLAEAETRDRTVSYVVRQILDGHYETGGDDA